MKTRIRVCISFLIITILGVSLPSFANEDASSTHLRLRCEGSWNSGGKVMHIFKSPEPGKNSVLNFNIDTAGTGAFEFLFWLTPNGDALIPISRKNIFLSENYESNAPFAGRMLLCSSEANVCNPNSAVGFIRFEDSLNLTVSRLKAGQTVGLTLVYGGQQPNVPTQWTTEAELTCSL